MSETETVCVTDDNDRGGIGNVAGDGGDADAGVRAEGGVVVCRGTLTPPYTPPSTSSNSPHVAQNPR